MKKLQKENHELIKGQRTLDSFIKSNKISTPNNTPKKYFYLLWINKYSPVSNAYWTDDKPDKISFIQKIYCNYIKEGFYFYICCYFTDYNERNYSLLSEKIYQNITYLKSHLEVSVKDMDDNLAIQTALHLGKIDIEELLRCISTIMISHTFLHESFNTIIWLMIALSTDKFKMKKYIYEWIIGVVYVICKIPTKDIDLDLSIDKDKFQDNTTLFENYLNNLNESQYSILFNIHIKIAYTGDTAKDEINLLNKCHIVWFERLKNKKNIDYLKNDVKPISIDSISDLLLDEWNVNAIFYTCNERLLPLILKKYIYEYDIDLDEEELKKIIFNNSFNKNRRCKNITLYNNPIWIKVKGILEKAQKYLLDYCY